jgi:hypothetical protein
MKKSRSRDASAEAPEGEAVSGLPSLPLRDPKFYHNRQSRLSEKVRRGKVGGKGVSKKVSF